MPQHEEGIRRARRAETNNQNTRGRSQGAALQKLTNESDGNPTKGPKRSGTQSAPSGGLRRR